MKMTQNPGTYHSGPGCTKSGLIPNQWIKFASCPIKIKKTPQFCPLDRDLSAR